jgi:2-dehydropantoate 2-reductase
MRFAIAGPGALGCLMAAKLTEAAVTTGDSLWILDHDPDRADYIHKQGIIYEKLDLRKQYPINASADPLAVNRIDVFFLCVKSYDLKLALEFWQPLFVSGVIVVFMQNGIAHLEFRDKVGSAIPAYGCTSEGATYLGAGHTRHAGNGSTFLGFLEESDSAAEDLLGQTVSALENGGLMASVSDSILSRLWAKLFVNVGINALTAIHNCLNGDLLSLPGVEAEMKAAVLEAEQVAAAKGISVEKDPYRTTVEVCRATAANISSMRQDVLKKRRTEIDAINGAVVKEAAKFGIQTPVNTSLVERIKEMEKGYGVYNI